MIAPYIGHPSPFPVTEPLKETPKDANLIYVNSGNSIGGLFYALLAPAAETMGTPLEQVKGGYTAPEAQSAFQTVVQKEPSAAITAAIPIQLWAPELKEMQEKNIPMITAGISGTKPFGIEAAMNAEGYGQLAGKLLANYVYAEMNQEAQVALYYLPEVSVTQELGEVFEKELASICPDCSTRMVPIKVEEDGTTAPATITSDLQSHPDTNLAVFGSDEIETGLPSALQAAGIDIETLGASPGPENLQYIKEGKETAALALDFPVDVWMLQDMAARLILGQELVPAEKEGVADQQFLTQKDITFDPSKGWTGYPDFAERFAKLWGVNGPYPGGSTPGDTGARLEGAPVLWPAKAMTSN